MYRALSELTGASTMIRTIKTVSGILEHIQSLPPAQRRRHVKEVEDALRNEAFDAFLEELKRRPYEEREAAVDAWYAANAHTFRAQAEKLVAEEEKR